MPTPSDCWTPASRARTEAPLEPPPGYAVVEELARRPGVRVVRARRGERDVHLRLEAAGGREGAAELAVLAAVDHPGLARLEDHGALAGGGRFVARAWVPGEDLLAWSRGRDPEEIGRVVAEAADALDHLHRLGFVHADLKAENVLVRPDGSCVLADYGLARAAGAPDPEAGAVGGTLYALAPEVLLGGSPTAASDLFALGALLHRLLAGERESARAFYARFPVRSFFDAAGTAPDRLPAWSRDLVAALVARDPARRPASAGTVARALRARLGLAPGAAGDAGELRFPLEQGRERWMQAWHAEVARPAPPAGPPHLYVRLPPGEDAAAIAGVLRLFASVRGTPTAGLDLDLEVRDAGDLDALDRWAQRRAAELRGVCVVSQAGADRWATRALELLARALAQRGPEPPARLVLVAAAPPPEAPAGAFDARDLPPVAEERVRAFLAARMPRETPARREELATTLSALARGAATRIDLALRRACAEGFLLPDDGGGHRLRPGPPPTSLGLAPPETGGADDLAALADDAREALALLFVRGGRLEGGALDALAAGARGSAGILALLSRRLAAFESGPRGRALVLTAPIPDPSALGLARLARLHAARAAALEARAGEDDLTRALVHRLAAGEDVGAVLADRLDGLVRRGAAERALALLDRVERFRAGGAAEPPRLALVRAAAWSALGRPERAEPALERLAALPRADARGLLALGRARLAAERRDAGAALALCEEAERADPALRDEVALARVQLLHELGRDEETRAAAERALELLAPGDERRRAFVASLAAVSAFRLGRVGEARQALLDLLARPDLDPALEGALRIDLATVERRAGDLGAAERELRAAAAAYEACGHAAGLAHARAALGGLLRDRGEMLAAEPLLAAALGTRERIGDLRGASTVRGIHGLLCADRGHARAAIEELERAARSMEGAQRIRFAPLCLARADEARARIGLPPAAVGAAEPETPDPRVLVARARAAWMRGAEDAARAAARRAAELARALGLAPVAAEAAMVLASLDPDAPEPPAAPPSSLAEEDRAVLGLLDAGPDAFDARAASELAAALEARGRDDRAARLWLAVSARAADPASDGARAAQASAERALARAALGLTADEAEALRRHLLGTPDPWPGDLIPRAALDEDWDMQIVELLDINRRLVEQQDLASLLGEIVDAALKVTGAERGFLVLEEDGEIRFDTAHDSRRGDIAQPDFEVSGSILREALDRMQPLRLSNAVDDPLLGHTPSVVSLELRSILCVPFQVDGRARGAIYADHRLRTGAFGEKAERLCALLADQAALAIRQMRRLGEIRELNARLARKVESQEEDLQAARRALEQAGIAAKDDGLIGRSPAMARVRALIDRAAKSGLTALVTGPSGSGKELAARALHRRSRRAGGPFVSESCAALPASLIEAELFGYRRGAFTGAEEDREGLFERARGGTLFLDEIGEMPLELQSKLLRVLETGEVRRIGDADARAVDFRLVAATNRDLAREVQEGRFRQDLYYRLDGLRIEMPSLEERREDVPELALHFLALEAAAEGRTRRASPAVLQRLAARAWPGNVRELRNEVARLCVLSEGDLVDPDLVRAPGPEAGEAPAGAAPDGPPPTLAELERTAILEALRYARGDKRKAAEVLGISRAKVYQRLKEWGVEHSSG